MRLCQRRLCDNAADVWWHGAWCASCADKEFGRVPMFIAALEMRDVPRALDPGGAGRPERPLEPGAAVMVRPSSSAAAPALPSFEELEDILAHDGWREIQAETGMDGTDLEWRLLSLREEAS
jgi:hypothetical protein